MKKFNPITLAITIASIVGFVIAPQPNLAQNNHEKIVLKTTTQQAQQLPSISNEAGRELIQKLRQCMVGVLPNQQQASIEDLQVASMECTMKVIMLNPDGTFRSDSGDLMKLLLMTTGATLPTTSSQGQASIGIQQLPNSQVFTLPVTVGGMRRNFLLDTGASNSILASQVARQIGLAGTAIPNELLSYFVVGNDCSNVNATFHNLPPLMVDRARVEGMTGMGLPETAIPGNLSGVLGLDFLKSFDAIVDPQSLRLQLLPPSPSVAGAIPLVGRLGVMIAEVKINDRGPFLFLLDTGADLMVISDRLARELSIDVARAEVEEVLGFCGTETARKTKLNRVGLQQHEVAGLDAVILQHQVLDLLGVDGIVGQNFLTRYRQHWRFGEANALGFPEEGSLVLTPLRN